jgi:chitin synthase
LTSKSESIAWIWAILIAFSIPEIGTFMRSARLCFFKRFRGFKMIEFGLISIIEVLYVIGLAMLTFKVLPMIDVIQGAMITNCLCFIPAVLGHKMMKVLIVI